MIKFLKSLFKPEPYKKVLEIYADSSWKDGKTAFSYANNHNKIFHVSELFICDSSAVAEVYSVQYALSNCMRIALENDYTHIHLYTDLKILERLNTLHEKPIRKQRTCLFNSIFNTIDFHINLYHNDINVTVIYSDHKKEPHLRLVDLLAYRQIQGIALTKYKQDVFKELSNWKVKEFVFETFD